MSARRSVAKATLPVLLLLTVSLPAGVASSVGLAHAGGGVVFTFNGGYASAPVAAQTLAAHGFHGTFYVVSGTLRQGPYYADYMSASDVANLSIAGHDVGSMTVHQPDLTTLTAAQLESELADSRTALQAITGAPVDQLAYPYGAVNDAVSSATATHYASGRILTSTTAAFTGSVDSHHLPGLVIGASTTLAAAQAYVDFAQANDVFIVLSFDRIVVSPGAYDWTPSDLDALAAYVQGKGMTVETVSQLVTGASPPPPGAPAPPTVTAIRGNASVTLTWTTPSNGGSPITNFTLYRGTSSGTLAVQRSLGLQNTYVDTNVTNGVTYYYAATATNALGESDRSNEASATPSSQIVPTGARLVFAFDNGYASGVTAAQILETRGFHGTFYASSALLRQGTFYAAYMSAADLVNLTGRGHEIGSMTVDQKDLTTLTTAQARAELQSSQSDLQNVTGAPVRQLAYPYGAVNANVASLAATYYASGLTTTTDVNAFASPPVDKYHIPELLVMRSTTLAVAKTYADFAISHNASVILSFANIVTAPGAYDWTPSDLDALAGYVQSKGLPVVTMAEYVASGPAAPPSTPSGPVLAAIPGAATVNIAWSVPDNHGSPITGYQIYKSTTTTTETLYRTLGLQTTFKDINVSNGVTYFYQVTAINGLGEGDRSNEASARPNATGVPPGASIVITFDDGLRSQLTAIPTLDQYGFKATFFINAGNLRGSGNDNQADNPESMSSAELQKLAQGGQDIESHLLFHDDATMLSASQLDTELKTNQMTLRAITGEPVNDLAWPYGAHNAATDAAAAKYYRSARTYNSDLSIATAHSTAKYGVPSMGVFGTDSAAKIDGYVDYAISHNVTVVLVIHNLAPLPKSYGVTLDNYDWNLAAFKQVMAYVAAKKVPVRTIAQLGDAGRLPPN